MDEIQSGKCLTKSLSLHILNTIDSEGEEYLLSKRQRESASGWKQISQRRKGSALRSQARGNTVGAV